MIGVVDELIVCPSKILWLLVLFAERPTSAPVSNLVGMLLSARMLKDVANVNVWETDTSLSWTQGDSLTIYFQLVDLNVDKSSQGFNPVGRRYVPASGATLQVTIDNIDDAKKVTRFAVQPFANDGSIWSFQIMASDPIRGTPQMRLQLAEGAVVTSGLAQCSLKIYLNSNV